MFIWQIRKRIKRIVKKLLSISFEIISTPKFSMFTEIIPKLPMRNKAHTKKFYCEHLRFDERADYGNYLILGKDRIELHFFAHPDLIPRENDGQVYIRTAQIEAVYASFLADGVTIHPNGALETKPWGQKEFSVLDPDDNLLTFGEGVER